MKQKSIFEKIAVWIIIIIPLIYLAIIYKDLPQRVPTHFGIDGKANAYSDKSDLWWMVPLVSVISFGVYLLLNYLPKIDPKKNVARSAPIFHKLSLALVILLSCINIFVSRAAMGKSFELEKFLLPVLGLFFAYIGNLMYNIKPNYFAGIRIPWTLENEDNWRATHRLAARLWFAGGIFACILTLALPLVAGTISFMIILFIIIIIPIIFSYRYFKKHQSS